MRERGAARRCVAPDLGGEAGAERRYFEKARVCCFLPDYLHLYFAILDCFGELPVELSREFVRSTARSLACEHAAQEQRD